MGEIVTIFFAILIGWQTPLAAIHLLGSLYYGFAAAIALGFEEADGDIMQRKPINRRKGLFADGLGVTIFLEGAMIGTLALVAFSFGRHIYGDITVAQTMAFCVLCLSQLVHAFNMRSEESLFTIGFFSNKVMNLAFGACVALQLAVICILPLSKVFKVVPLSGPQWLIVAAFGALCRW